MVLSQKRQIHFMCYASQDIHVQFGINERHCYSRSTFLVALFMLFAANKITYMCILE